MFDEAISNLVTGGAWVLAFLAVLTMLQIGLRRIARQKRGSKSAKPARAIVVAEHRAAARVQNDQLGDARFVRRPVLNKTEFRVFAVVEGKIAELKRGHRVMAQVSLGEVLCTDPAITTDSAGRAFAAINAKRLDIAVIDRSGLLVLAIEVQGAGHYQGNGAYLRDAVKREALRRAGVEMLEITPDWDNATIEAELNRRLSLAAVA